MNLSACFKFEKKKQEKHQSNSAHNLTNAFESSR